MSPVPPTRLRDDPEAPHLVRADLARAAKLPAVAFDAAQGLAALEAAIQAAGPAAPGATSGAAVKPLAAALAKGALLGLVAVGVANVSSSWLDSRSTPRPPHPAVAVASAAPVAAPPAPIEPLDVPSQAAPVPAPHADPGAPIARRLPAADPIPSAAAVATPNPAPAPPPAPSGESQLQMEMENLARLRAASDPQQALALAEEGPRRFPSGVYAQEREAHAIFALVHLGRRADAAARARAFVAAYPKSPLVERIREQTGTGDKE
jgi:hypothetical protein